MFDKNKRRVSYKEQKYKRHRLLRILLCFLACFALYNAICAFFFSIWSLENNAMQPGLRAGDRLIVMSYALPSFFSRLGSSGQMPFKRGNIVLVDHSRAEKKGIAIQVLNAFVRFFTAQRMSLSGMENFFIKRLVALPGDEISMTNFVLRIKPADSAYTLTEFELSGNLYYPEIPRVPALWDESLPFSGNIEAMILGDDEYFVISDDRANTNDSRTWGPVSSAEIAGKAALRIWPLSKIGRP